MAGLDPAPGTACESPGLDCGSGPHDKVRLARPASLARFHPQGQLVQRIA
jgi:hypothetical protein